MSLKPFITRFLFRALIVVEILSLTACGSADQESADVEQAPTAELQPQVAEELQQESESEGVAFEEAELPEGFPSSFPMPEDTRVASNVSTGKENEFRVYLSLTLTAEDAIAFYLQALPANGWTIEQQEETFGGTELRFSSDELLGQMLFVEAETGVGLDVHLYPPESAEQPPELGEEFGQSGSLGDTASDFPDNLPLPTGFTPIDLTSELQAEGYQLAFSYSDAAEMAMVELNIALMTAGWEVNDPSIDPMSATYIIPFVDPETGFAGYAYITRSQSGVALIALAPGQP